MSDSVTRKALVISGGSKGIGLATARRFADAGYSIINLSRTPVPLDSAQQLTVDFTAPDWDAAIANELAQALEGMSSICLVHNAGLLTKGGVPELDAETLRRSLEVNVVASVILNARILPLMHAGSSIIYVGSTLSEKAVANSAAYVVAKHAVAGLMRSTCQDLAGQGIHTACVCPGFTETEMLLAHVGGSREVLDAIAGNVTQKRLIEPSEIAETIYFCSQHPVMNGAVVHANLGQIES